MQTRVKAVVTLYKSLLVINIYDGREGLNEQQSNFAKRHLLTANASMVSLSAWRWSESEVKCSLVKLDWIRLILLDVISMIVFYEWTIHQHRHSILPVMFNAMQHYFIWLQLRRREKMNLVHHFDDANRVESSISIIGRVSNDPASPICISSIGPAKDGDHLGSALCCIICSKNRIVCTSNNSFISFLNWTYFFWFSLGNEIEIEKCCVLFSRTRKKH